MNCKPGDVAYVVGSPNGRNFGRVVSIVRHASTEEVVRALQDIGIDAVPGRRPPVMWFVDPPLIAKSAVTGKEAEMPYAIDAYLRPIRPNGITDEEVRELYLSSPVKTTEPA
jgi:hypothetical protein